MHRPTRTRFFVLDVGARVNGTMHQVSMNLPMRAWTEMDICFRLRRMNNDQGINQSTNSPVDPVAGVPPPENVHDTEFSTRMQRLPVSRPLAPLGPLLHALQPTARMHVAWHLLQRLKELLSRAMRRMAQLLEFVDGARAAYQNLEGMLADEEPDSAAMQVQADTMLDNYNTTWMPTNLAGSDLTLDLRGLLRRLQRSIGTETVVDEFDGDVCPS